MPRCVLGVGDSDAFVGAAQMRRVAAPRWPINSILQLEASRCGPGAVNPSQTASGCCSSRQPMRQPATACASSQAPWTPPTRPRHSLAPKLPVAAFHFPWRVQRLEKGVWSSNGVRLRPAGRVPDAGEERSWRRQGARRQGRACCSRAGAEGLCRRGAAAAAAACGAGPARRSAPSPFWSPNVVSPAGSSAGSPA